MIRSRIPAPQRRPRTRAVREERTKEMNTKKNTRNVHGRAPARIDDAPSRRGAALRTPYHALGADQEMRVPVWAQHRSVYRTAGRTIYLVETDRLADARGDLATLDRAGWDVRIAAGADGDPTRIALTRREFARAA